ncbi:MAG: Signal transduction histidine kinase [Deltaproteobacteria bacterium]|nr:Signal transduction histidine kinase [Deltaproteobacteria bacterium]
MLAHPTQHMRSGEKPPVATQMELSGLGNRFLGLLGRKWSRRSFAAEVAKLLAATARARAVAVLAYERQADRLVLLADWGLSGEARLALGGAADTVWDIPVRGLKSRRISVVEAAHQNPLIPETLRSLGAEGALCVVSLPLYYDAVPVGAVVLFVGRNRAFSDAQLQTLSQALRVCGRGLREPAAVRVPNADQEAGGGQPHQPSEAVLPAAGQSEAGVLAGAAAAPGPAYLRLVEGEPVGVGGHGVAEAGGTEVPPGEPEYGRAQAEMQRRNEALGNLMRASRAVRAERDRLRQHVADLEAVRARETEELRGQLGTLEDRLLAVESERQRAQRVAEAQRRAADEALQAVRSERDTLRAHLDALESRTAETANRVSALGEERDALTVQLRAVHAEQDQLREQYAHTREAFAVERERWQAEQALETTQRARHAEELAALHAQVEQFRLAAAERDALAQLVTGLRGTVAELEGAVSVLQEQLTAARAEGARATEGAAGALAELEAERRHRREAAAAAAHQQRGLQEAIGELQVECQRLAGEREQAREALQQADSRGDALEREAAELREHLRRRDASLEAVAAESERLQCAQQAAEAVAAAAAAEIEELRGAVLEAARRLEQERLEHASELEALLREAAPEAAPGAADDEAARALPFPPSPETADAAAVDDALTIERSAPLTPLADVVLEAVELPAPTPTYAQADSLGELVVLDDGTLADQACAALAAAGFEVTAQPLGEATVDDLARRKLKCIMLNLGAGAAAWRTLRMLRERTGTRNVPVLAYVMSAQVPTGFCLGRVDFALWPLEPGRLIERLGRLRPKLQRLLFVSADVEGMGALREPLGRAKISSSIVLDAKQALEFASMVEPDAAIVHLAPTCPSAARAIAGLRANEPTRDLPILVLMDAASMVDDEAFFTSAGRQLLGRSGFQFSRLPEEIGRLIG